MPLKLWKHLPNYFHELKGIAEQVIVGSHEGSLQLWNINTNRKLYDIKGWSSAISSCVSSPALDVVAVGCADGKIHVHNIRYDEEVITFSHAMRGAVTALSFSTGRIPQVYSLQDHFSMFDKALNMFVPPIFDIIFFEVSNFLFYPFADGQPLLASGSSSGVISIWNLEKRRLQSVIKDAHDSSIISLYFFANEPVLMSSSGDNSIKVDICCLLILFYLL